jgi:hypothetical protein
MTETVRVSLHTSYPERTKGTVDRSVLPTWTADTRWASFMGTVDAALEVLDPNGSVVPISPNGRARMVAFGVRRMDVSADIASVRDYEVPPWTWCVREDGVLYGDSLNMGLRRFSFEDAARASDDKYNAHDYRDVLVWKTDGGQGGGGAYVDVVNFLLQLGVELGTAGGAAWLQAKLFALRRTRRADAKARLQVKRWENRGIGNPAMIRLWFDTKSTWAVGEVAKRLQIQPYAAQRMLRALGYEPTVGANDCWRLSANSKPRKRRRKWLKSETAAWEPEAY